MAALVGYYNYVELGAAGALTALVDVPEDARKSKSYNVLAVGLNLIHPTLVTLTDAGSSPDYYKDFLYAQSVVALNTSLSWAVVNSLEITQEPHKRLQGGSETIGLNVLTVSTTPTPPHVLPAPGTLWPLIRTYLLEPEDQ